MSSAIFPHRWWSRSRYRSPFRTCPGILLRAGSAGRSTLDLQGRLRSSDGPRNSGPAETRDPHRTLWIFRYYDLNERNFAQYGEILVRLIEFIRSLAVNAQTTPKVNIVAHSMGGLIVREAIQHVPSAEPERG